MFRLTAAIVMLALLGSVPSAQPRDDIVQGGNVEGLPLYELVELTSALTGMTFQFNAHQVRGVFNISARREGFRVPRTDLPMILQDALEQHWLAFVPHGETWTIVQLSEVVPRAPLISETELETVDDAHWVSVILHLNSSSALEQSRVIRNHSLTLGGTVQPVPDSVLVICERADRLRRLVKRVREADRGPELLFLNLPTGAKAEDAAHVLRGLFTEQGAAFPTFAAVGGKLMARAPQHMQPDFEEALQAMAAE